MTTEFFDVAQLALDCVCAAMDAAVVDIPGYSCPCVAFVSAGEPALDCCDINCGNTLGGQLTVHWENIFPSDNFPSPSGGFDPCKASSWVANLVVTSARCAPTMDEQGTPAPPDAMTANARLMAVDAWAIMTALSCCVVNEPVAGKRKRRISIIGSTALVTGGGCAAVEVRAAVEVSQVCSCGPVAS